MVATRAAEGLSAAFVVPTTLAMLSSVFPAGPARNRAFAIWGGLSAVAGTVGLAAGGLPEVLTGLGAGIATVPSSVAALAGVPAERAGVASALLNVSRQLGGALGLVRGVLPGAAAQQGGDAVADEFSHDECGVGAFDLGDGQDLARDAVQVIGVGGDRVDEQVGLPADPVDLQDFRDAGERRGDLVEAALGDLDGDEGGQGVPQQSGRDLTLE
jgi:hypothetical protein